MTAELYRRPEYYDIAFTWDLTKEIEFFSRVFARHVLFPVKRVLEPACGTGRFLVALPRHGYDVTGYDASPAMLAFARRRIGAVGDPTAARAIEADMRTARFDREFDAALNSINSIGYLLTDADLVAHFRNTGASLRRGGVYIVHLSCAWEGEPDRDRNVWEAERDGIRVRTSWRIERDDREAKISHQVCAMEIDERGRISTFTDRHEVRLWFSEDVMALVAASRTLEFAALYSERFEPLPLDTRVTGEMGNLYYVLAAV